MLTAYSSVVTSSSNVHIVDAGHPRGRDKARRVGAQRAFFAVCQPSPPSWCVMELWRQDFGRMSIRDGALAWL